jgi:hypothetical protein
MNIKLIVLLAFLLPAISSAMVGAQCPEVKAECMNSACAAAGGNVSTSGVCVHLENFDNETYDVHQTHCYGLYDYCIENDGLIHNMSFCGPIFIFLSALMLALYAGGS